jgi:hypothetical protein
MPQNSVSQMPVGQMMMLKMSGVLGRSRLRIQNANHGGV